MKSNKEVLTSVLKTTQMGQLGIRSVLDAGIRPDLRNAIESQLREYDAIETEANSIAKRRDWTLSELNPSLRFMMDSMTKAKLMTGEKNSKVAAMMIHGNTNGIIKGYKNLHQMQESDSEVRALSEKLLKTESSNVNQMKSFL